MSTEKLPDSDPVCVGCYDSICFFDLQKSDFIFHDIVRLKKGNEYAGSIFIRQVAQAWPFWYNVIELLESA